MRLLRLAIESQRWDLAAHTIVFATAKLLNNVAQGDSTGRGDMACPPKRSPVVMLDWN